MCQKLRRSLARRKAVMVVFASARSCDNAVFAMCLVIVINVTGVTGTLGQSSQLYASIYNDS